MSSALCLPVSSQNDCISQTRPGHNPRMGIGVSLLTQILFTGNKHPVSQSKAVNPFFSVGDPRFQYQTIFSHSVWML